MPDFSEFLQVPTDVKESINITDGGSIKLLISEMSNIGLKSDSTGRNYNGTIAQKKLESFPS